MGLLSYSIDFALEFSLGALEEICSTNGACNKDNTKGNNEQCFGHLDLTFSPSSRASSIASAYL